MLRIVIVLLYCAVVLGPSSVASCVVDRELLSNFSMTKAADLAALTHARFAAITSTS